MIEASDGQIRDIEAARELAHLQDSMVDEANRLQDKAFRWHDPTRRHWQNRDVEADGAVEDIADANRELEQVIKWASILQLHPLPAGSFMLNDFRKQPYDSPAHYVAETLDDAEETALERGQYGNADELEHDRQLQAADFAILERAQASLRDPRVIEDSIFYTHETYEDVAKDFYTKADFMSSILEQVKNGTYNPK